MTVTQDDYWSQVSTSMIDKIIETTTRHQHHKNKQPLQQQKYQILEELGRGSYGCLFLGQSLLDNSYVAIKVLCKTGLDHQQLELQQLEIDIQLGLKHNNLLTLHGTTQDKDYIYMVMELCDQGDLFDFVVRNNKQAVDGDQEEEEEQDMVVQTFSQILEAIDYMHQHSVYHRDLKLENILLKTSDLDDNLIECKVADFGLATRERYNMEFGCGSTSYLAPEHFDNDQDDSIEQDYYYQENTNGGKNKKNEQSLVYDAAASDIWSLGILLLALLFGRNPWEEATMMDMAYREFQCDPMVLKDQLFPTLSTGCYRFLKSVLSPNPAERPSITEMKHQFKALDRLTITIHDEEHNMSIALEDAVLVDNGNNMNDLQEDYYRWPMDIPTTGTTTSVSTAAAVAAGKKSDKVSFDSAIFSGTYRAGSTGESWSDMVEEEDEEEEDVFGPLEDAMSSSTLSSYSTSSCSLDDDTDMFIHTQEKGSWWL
ncbi:kinase-like domain-containing protein [Circinella umbellata]|nr:kinase-like domain-containing protein [Circinella umbellata]